MMVERIKVSKIKPNPNNPRTIKKEQLEKLKKSIMEFPDMLELRPIVLDENYVVLGGNMRLKAIKDLGYEEVPYIKVDDLTEEQKEQFIIKDNLNYGEWNWEVLQADWNLSELDVWGLDLPSWLNDDDKEPEFDESDNHKWLQTYINSKVKQITLFLSAEQYEEVINAFDKIMENEGLESNTEVVLFLMEKYYESKRG